VETEQQAPNLTNSFPLWKASNEKTDIIREGHR
jgi:hypothetical protein